jgi:hypothetical protein
LGGNFPTSVAARKSITALSHFSMESSSETCTCRHRPALHPVAFPPLSRASSAGLSIGYSGGRDAPASGPPSCLRRLTTSICRHVGVRTVLGTCPLVRVQTSVGRTWLLEASHCSLGWVSCFQLCLSAWSRDAYCTCRPPTQPLPPSLLLRFVWSCSPPRCILALVLCLLCGPLSLDSLGDLLPHFRGCQCVLVDLAVGD